MSSIDSKAHHWLELVHESVIVRDRAGRILAWNRASAELYGFPPERAIGAAADELLRSQYPEPPALSFDASAGGTGWEGIAIRTHADGRALEVKVRWAMDFDAAGAPAAVVETGFDRTELNQQQAALAESEYRYRNLFEAMAASFWVCDFTQTGAMIRALRKQGVEDLQAYFAAHPEFVRAMMEGSVVVDCNEQSLALVGGGKQDVIGKGTEWIWAASSTADYAGALLASVGGAANYSVETRLRRLDGSEFDALFTACFPSGTVKRGLLLIGIIDISARKQAFAALERSELRYRTLFQSMAVGFWQIDTRSLNERFAALRAQGVSDLRAYMERHPRFVDESMDNLIAVDVNDQALRLFGGGERRQMLGPIRKFWLPERLEAIRGSIESAYRNETGYQAETVMRTIDGRPIDVLFFVTGPQEMRSTGIVLVGAIDISEQVAARAERRSLQAELAHAARVSILGELTASIAHEVNQPLAAITTNGEASLRWLNRPQPDLEEVRALTQYSIADARRAADIIARIRTMAKRRAPETAALSLNDVVEEALQFLQPELRAHHVELGLSLGADLGEVRADRIQLQQVVVNLVMNALQAMDRIPAGRSIRVVTRSAQDGKVCLDVEDSGPGLPPEGLPRLFESFYTTKEDGVGLGLAVCRSILHNYGGEIRAANRETGQGARFTVTLPARS